MLHLTPGLMMFACTGTMAIRAPTQDLHGVLGVLFSLILLQFRSLTQSHSPGAVRRSRACAAGPVHNRPPPGLLWCRDRASEPTGPRGRHQDLRSTLALVQWGRSTQERRPKLPKATLHVARVLSVPCRGGNRQHGISHY